MKCIKYIGPKTNPVPIKRLPDDKAAAYVNDDDGWWQYCPKSEWKQQERKND